MFSSIGAPNGTVIRIKIRIRRIRVRLRIRIRIGIIENVMVNWQLSKRVSADQYHLTVSRALKCTAH